MINYTIDDDKTLSENHNIDFETLETKINDVFESIFNDMSKKIASFDVLKIVFTKIDPDELAYMGSICILERFGEFVKKKSFENIIKGVVKKAPKHLLFLAYTKVFLDKAINSLTLWRCLTIALAVQVYAPYIAGYLK